MGLHILWLLAEMRLVCTMVLLALQVFGSAGFNIDTQRPIVRGPPSQHENQVYDLFGYQGVLHSRQINTPSTTTAQALSNTVILVGAPNGTAEGAVLQNTGILFECPLSSGTCTPFRGDGISTNDRRLYDTTGNSNEVKQDQRLGVSMDSTGDRFIVCGNRYRHDFFFEAGGVCFLSGRNLEGFQRYRPCFSGNGNNRNIAYQNEFNPCAAGTSVSLLNNGNILFGAPATSVFNDDFRGASIVFNSATNRYHFSDRLDPVGHVPTPGDKDSRSLNSYSDYHRGYSTVRGRIFSNNPNGDEDLIVGMPRGQGGRFLGAIGVHRQEFLRSFVARAGEFVRYNSMPNLVYLFEGTQIGSYFGGTVAAVDVNNDGYDEVFAAAPLYAINSQLPEAGVVTVYINSRGSLNAQNSIEIQGPRKAYARFGHAITGIGDINGDGFNDVVISAPFRFGGGSDTYTGAIYIYAGSSTSLQATPIQVIEGSSLNLLPNLLDGLSGFGSSLFSLDVDNNGFQDLLVGAFQSRKMFVLRTRPVLNVISSILANVTSINDTSACVFESTPRRCFSVEVCLRTSGRGFPINQQFDVNYNLSTDSRVFFGEGGLGATRIQSQIRTVVNGSSACNSHVVYILADVLAITSPLAVGVSPFVSDGSAQLAVSNGNEQPADLANRPAASVSGLTQALVLTNLDCGGDNLCTTDLTVEQGTLAYLSRTITGMQFTKIIISQVTDIIVSFEVRNGGPENSYGTQAIISFSTAFSFSRIEGNSSISCLQATLNGMNIITCEIGALIRPNERVPVSVRLVALEGRLTGTEGSVNFQLNVTSNSQEVNPGNNAVTLSADVASIADIQTSLSASSRQFLTVPGKTTDFPSVQQFSDIGRQIQVNVTATNLGPSLVRSGRIVVRWPLAHRCTGNRNFLFYLASVRLESIQGSCTVSPSNALDYHMVEGKANPEQYDGTSVTPPAVNATHPFTVPEGSENAVDCSSQDLTQLSAACETSDDYCVQITCDVSSHQVSGTGLLSITGYIDDAFFANEPRDWNVIISANYTILDEFVTEISGAGSRSNDGLLAVSIISQSVVPPRGDVPIWVIIVPIILGLIFVVIVVIILYFCGFFKRKNWKKLREENEEENGNGNTNASENGNENGTNGASENGNENVSTDQTGTAVKA